MLEKIFSSSTIPLLNRAMDVASDRDTIIADNIANEDTPNFKRRELIFEEKLKKSWIVKQIMVNLVLAIPVIFRSEG